jgi:hypothetical protein
MKSKQSLWPVVVLLIILFGIACIVEPCDGHSCDAEVSNVR